MSDYNVYSRHCPARLFFDRLAERWVLLIIGLLRQQPPLRFNEIKREVDGISQKVLSQKLKLLERDGLVAREVYPSMPVRVEYRLTELGRSYADTIEQVSLWAQQHVETLLAAQLRFDETQAAEEEERARPPLRFLPPLNKPANPGNNKNGD